MSRVRAAIASAAVSLTLAGPAGAQTFELLDLSGKELFDRFCAACHGSSGPG